MAVSQEIETKYLNEGENALSGDEVVISGISGLFPNSDNVKEFMDNLYNKVNMVTTDEAKWKLNDPDVPKYIGQIRGTNKFDAQFFGVTYQLACAMEPMGRKLMEQAYQAIFDSGTSPQSLKGKRVGVFVGAAYTDNSALSMFDIKKRSDFVVNGSSKAMLANRISYWIDGKGPSYGLDYSCSSSTACLEIAYNSIKSGECDAAIVGGCNYGVHPNLNLNMRRAGLLCLDGKTKCFDKNADGYVRADAVNVIFLQRAKDAHRIYAEVFHAKGTYNMRPDAQFLPLRPTEDIENFLNDVYSETKLNPKKVEYVEAHGAAIATADENELAAISNIFANNNQVKVGCVKSNMGHSDAASGLCAVTKLCLAYHKGELPANLHYNEPHDQIAAVRDGRIQVVTENTRFQRGYTALNNFSLTGANFHVVLKGHYKEKNLDKYKSQVPRIVLASGRQESCVEKILDIMKNHHIDAEEVALLHKVFEHDIPGHTGRGYAILDTNENNETVCISEGVDYYPGVKRPLWFVYSGMGSQWPGMGADLMRIPTFAAAIHKCHKVLEPKGIDLIRIVTELDNTIFDNILNAFVGIGAVQIGLTDVIKEMGIVPDYIIGHSLGEMACAYHDNTFTAEELILSTYARGKVVLEGDLVKGSMAAVGLGYQAIVNQCPPEIDVACHNSGESATISGPADKMKEFVGDLTKRGIFAKEVPCANIAYHSRYIAKCGPQLMSELRKVIKNPKKRSAKWISTSVPQDKWDEPNAIYSSAEYHTNNLLKPVLFEEMSKMIPENAVVVEIAPHGLLQAILKRSHKECTHIPLTRRGNTDGVNFFLDAIGKLYKAGFNPKVDVLYPKVEFPVSTETPLLSHFVEWEHSEDWPEMSFVDKAEVRVTSARNVTVSVHDDDYEFLKGFVRNGINVLPESAILVLVWETLAMHVGNDYNKQSVIFRDIHFHSEVVLRDEVPLRLSISINRGNNKFEVIQDDTRIASGIVSAVKVLKLSKQQEVERPESDEEEITLSCEDVYRVLKSRGYNFRDKFQSIQLTNLDYDRAYIEWNKNWITFLDSLMQFNILSRNSEGLSVPKFIRKLRISTVDHNIISSTEEINGINCLVAQYNHVQGIIRCAGVELDNITFIDQPITEQHPDLLMDKAFYPHYAMDKIDLKTAFQIIFQIVSENTTMKEIKTTEIVTSNTNINCIINEISKFIPNVTINMDPAINTDIDTLIEQNTDSNQANVFIIEDLLDNEEKLARLQHISEDSFVLALETGVPKLQGLMKGNFTVMSCMSDGKSILILLKKHSVAEVSYVPVKCDNKLDWVQRVYDQLDRTRRVVLVSEKQPYCGAIGFVKKLWNDGINKVSLVVIDDFHAPSFNPSTGIYKSQLEKNLAINIFRKGQWGGYYYTTASTQTNLRNVKLACTEPDVDALTWIEGPPTVASSNLVQVSYVGISLKDTENVLHNEEKTFGMDYSGIDQDGDRVMGIVSGGALGTTIEADSSLLWPVPDHWTLQDAATVPLPYAMAYYCLAIRGQLLEDQSVFVTGGAGALGQAVIAVSLYLGCKVYTTVSNVLKKRYLLRLFPQLVENNIGHSRNDSFLNMIKINTKGDGCDLVINCANGDLRETAMKCVAFNGFFLDLSTYDMKENNDIGMKFIQEDRSYKAVNFSNIFRPELAMEKKTLQRLISEGIANGTVRPISRVEYSPQDVTKAFRLLSSSRHIGKVLIRMRSPEIMKNGFDVIPRLTYSPKGVYIVVCDDNGIGIELADRLVKKGARGIILHTRSKVNGYWQTKFASWMKQNVTIRVSLEKLETQKGCTTMVKEAMKIGSVKGVFIVPDIDTKGNVEETSQDFVNKFNKITQMVVNLDLTTRNYCNELSHFVLLAPTSPSASSEFAFSMTERIFQGRSESGFPGLIVRTDKLFEINKTTKDLEVAIQPQTLSKLFNAMETSLKLKHKNVLYSKFDEEKVDNYLDKLAKIIGLSRFDNIQNSTIVSNLKLNEGTLEEIRALIRKTYKIDYPVEKIRQMTMESLKNIEGKDQTKERVDHKGLGAFYTCVDDEEQNLEISHPIVPMVTLMNNGAEKDLDPSETYLVMIPGFEGRYQIFSSVAERLKVQAVGVQLAPDMEGYSLPEMAATIRKFMKTKFESKSKFYLLGYSFGVNVALELASLLEKEGHIGVVYCLDSSPDALRIQLNSHLGELSDLELQNVVLAHLYELMAGERSEELNQYLKTTDDWINKLDACMYKLKDHANFSHQYKWAILNSAYIRILLAREYEPDFKLNSELVLIRGNSLPDAENLAEDYNLSKYTNKAVKVFHIDADHTTIPYDSRVSNIVNKMLDKNLLEKYKMKNLCDTYVLKSNEIDF